MYAEISDLLPGIRRVDESSLEILGTPIFESGLKRMFSSKVESLSLMCERLKLMDSCVFLRSLWIAVDLVICCALLRLFCCEMS